MKAPDFIYHRASSVQEAVQLLDEYDGNARILAGGQSLIPMLNMRLWRPSALIDINRIEGLDAVNAQGHETVLGARVRYNVIEHSALIAQRLPLLTNMIRYVGDRQVRHRGTVGGSLVQGDPTGEMPLAALTLGAKVKVVSVKGEREIPLTSFYEGSYATVLEPNEMVVSVIYPKHPPFYAFCEMNRRHNDFAVVSVAVAGEIDEQGHWQDVRIGMGGVNESPMLATDAASLLNGSRMTDEDIAQAAQLACTQADPPDDIRASGEYRLHLLKAYVRKALGNLRREASSAFSKSPVN
ncbi:xanthine dehydrogenase family protein subunit M [Pusillimonas sp. DMV24BSW_D]|uniref:FAD binding domain-containing protein n=1 Tax=Neopusillimonas aestuarii TaxID=2716226 RepID=UPI00140877FD|nr:xanthine dehydrogenase family protein subunit M [Pusillimonas sp. DMV24BSW_D]QIM48190.1 xanthine dehydrogenase family protein subunit M [Pusillimonas sp. DMV24BSW_D]